jgi:hypothetical protein
MKPINHLTSNELQQLRKGGVPVDRHIARKTVLEDQGLLITQTGSRLENTLFVSKSGMLNVIISIILWNNTDQNIRISDLELTPPVPCNDFHWLQPEASGGYVLRSLGTYGFDNSVVMNSRLGQEFVVGFHRSVEGLLLGEGWSPESIGLVHGAQVRTQLKAFASQGKKYHARITLYVDVALSRSEKTSNPENRGSLLGCT